MVKNVEADKNQNYNYIDISELLSRFFRELKKLWLPAIIVTAAFAALFAVRAKMNYTPMYQSRAMFTVSSGYSSDDILSYSYYYDNEAAKQLAAAFPYMLGTDVMNELVRNELGVSYINGSIRAEAVADTNLFVLTVTSSDPQDAYDILEAVIASYPRVALYMVDYSQVIMKSEPTVPTVPYNSFSWKGSAVKGGILGLGLSCLAALVLAMMRKTIFSAADLKASANVPILASVARGLSEGQAQRIAIARAILRDAPILLMDEATSALDVATERQVLRSILEHCPDKTCIVTTHRPSVLSMCSRVYRVLDTRVTELSEEESARMVMDF